MNCIRNLESSDINNIRKCIFDTSVCKKVSYSDKNHKCSYNNDYVYYVKISVDDDSYKNILYEYNMYVKIHNTPFSNMFENTPYFFQDEHGIALAFKTHDNVVTLGDLKRNGKLTKVMCNRVIVMLQTLLLNHIYFSDVHYDNVIFDNSSNLIYFIDLERLVIPEPLSIKDKNGNYTNLNENSPQYDIEDLRSLHNDSIIYWQDTLLNN